MNELELELRELGATLEFPETPALAARVRTRLETRSRRPFRFDRRAVAIGFAVVAVALAGVLAVPPARTAILEWLGIKGVELEFVDELPNVAVTEDLNLGERTTLEQARRRAGFRVHGPGELGEPSRVYFREPPSGGQVAFVYGTRERVRLLVTQFVGEYEPFIRKFLEPGVTVEEVDVDGAHGVWIEGAHLLAYEDETGYFQEEPVRLVDKVLLWRRSGVTFRIEGDLTRERAVQIAESLD
ncbi:MAG: hypothetical protein ICV59_00160 [Thermoleophilia bacterium]|nr:hypothetical protein [Thermoleophilia bacterium]